MTWTSPVLHITNGDSAAEPIRALGLGGDVLPWRDVLHEGPVPAPATLDSLRPIRARFLGSLGAGAPVDIARELEERDRRLGGGAADGDIALWFEHDLYDQLQLIQVLDWLATASHHGVVLAQSDDYLGCVDQAGLQKVWDSRTDVTDMQFDAARRAWRAFSAADPLEIEAVLHTVAPLPYMRSALVRHLEEFPAVENGLSRTERQALEALADGPKAFPDLFRAAHLAREDAIFLGDAMLEWLLTPLVEGGLLTHETGAHTLSNLGREVLDGKRDRVEAIGIDRWLGGVRLRGRRVPYRWDTRAQRIVTL